MLNKPVRRTSASLTDTEFTIFTTKGVVNYVRGGTWEMSPNNEFRFGSGNSSDGYKEIHVS